MPRMCCVPLCSSNYRSQGGPTVTTFAFPKNVDRRELWLKCIPRENFVPGNSAAVCIKHFKEEYILREVSATRDDGTILVVRRDRPKLSEDAYPSIFEDTSKTFSHRKKLPSRRGRGTTTKNEEDVIDEPPPSTPPKTEPTQIDVEISILSPPEKQVKKEKSDTEQTPKSLEPDVTIQEETTQGDAGGASSEVLTCDGARMYKTVIHTGQALYSCEFCPALFTSYFHLEEHERVHPGPRPAPVPPQRRTKATKAAKEGRAKAGVALACPVCQEQVASAAALRAHRRSHAAAKRHCCDACGKCFARASKLRVHQRVHTNERPFACETCGARFTQRGNLNIHRRTHSGERPFRCDACGAAFMQPAHLKVHRRRHTGERPYRCALCAAAFSQMTSLVLHRRTHTGERPFPCDACTLAFNSRGDLKVHQRRHTGERPYACGLCPATFSHQGTLNVHKRRHAGKRPFLCEACGVAFITLSELKTHKRRHTGEQPYRCEVCGAAFTQYSLEKITNKASCMEVSAQAYLKHVEKQNLIK